MRGLQQQRADAVRRAVDATECLHGGLHRTIDVGRDGGIDHDTGGTEFGGECSQRIGVAGREHELRT